MLITATNSMKNTTLKIRFAFFSALLGISSFTAFAQQKVDTLKTEEIRVVKPYTPTISDAFKIQSIPNLNQTSLRPKPEVNYSIFSVPVASTFTPSKGKVKTLGTGKKEKFYQNYITAGFGNYGTPLLESYIHSQTRSNDIGGFFRHQSSQGGIPDVIVDDNYADTRIDLYYKAFDRDYSWQVNGGYQNNVFNFYGLPIGDDFDQALIDGLDTKQVLNNAYLGGKFNLEDSFFKSGTLELTNFFDTYSSNEFRVLTKGNFEFPIATELITVNALIDYYNGSFDKDYFDNNGPAYSFFTGGITPNFTILRDDFRVDLGVKLMYNSDIERSESDFKFYPNIHGSFNVVQDVLVLLAGVEGDIKQNTYNKLTQGNSFVSPTLDIRQTDMPYRAYFGAKGKFSSNMGFSFNVSYGEENNKPLYLQNQTRTDGMMPVTYGYQLGNSFSVIYDDITNLGLEGVITLDVSQRLNFGLALTYNNYSTTNEEEAWNLPSFFGTLSADYTADKWYAGAQLYMRGATKELLVPFGEIPENGGIITNDSYLDFNLKGGYNFTDQLAAFVKFNNITGENYETFLYYQVQGFQALAGVTYKFDF